MSSSPFGNEDPTQRSDDRAPDDDRPAQAVPERIGLYRILRPLGEGGMGMVYEAEQDSPRRTVALKVIRSGLASREHLRRFELESQVLGLLQHPGIAQVYEAGTADTGSGPQAFFAMELIRGLTLLEHADHYRLDIRQRLQLMARICEAVHHAHLRGVIHRDLKPGNILVAEPGTNDIGQPKILDFGVARLTDADIQMTMQKTGVGQIIGTLPYMSPEQVSGDPEALDVRSDVYALGVILYQILSGEMPLDLSRRQIPEVVRMIQEEEPSRLSGYDHRLRGDVEVIVGKALEKSKERRYQSAEELGNDLQRFLTDQPIEARPPSTAYQLRKFARRNRALVGGVVTAFVLLVAGITASTWQAVRATQAEKLAAEEAAASQRVSSFLAEMLGDVDPERLGNTLVDDLRAQVVAQQEERGRSPEEVAATEQAFAKALHGVNRTDLARRLLEVEILERADQSIQDELGQDPLLAARLYHTLGETYHGLSLYQEAQAEFQKAIEIRSNELGVDDPSTLASRQGFALALSESRADDPLQDTALFEKIYEEQRKALGLEHPQTLVTLARLVDFESLDGQYLRADSLCRLVLDSRMRQLGPDHPATLEAVSTLGMIALQMEHTAEAGSLRVYAYETARKTLGPEDPRTLDFGYSLGRQLDDMDRYEESLALHEELVEIRERVQGRQHAKTIAEKRRLIHHHTNHFYRPDRAAPIYQDIITTRLEIEGPADMAAAKDALALARLMIELNQMSAADSIVTDTMERLEAEYGDLDRSVLRFRHRWATSLYDAGEKERAAEGLEQLILLQESALGPWHLDLSQTTYWRSRILGELGRCEEGEAVALRSIEIARRDDPESFTTARHMIWAGIFYINCGKFREAEALVMESLALIVEQQGEGSRGEAWAKSKVGQTLAGQGRIEDARPYYEDYLRIYRRLGESRPRLKGWLCSAILDDVAEPFINEDEVMQLAREANEASSYEDPEDLSLLAKAYAEFGHLDEAVKTQRKAVALMPIECRTMDQMRERLVEYEVALATAGQTSGR